MASIGAHGTYVLTPRAGVKWKILLIKWIFTILMKIMMVDENVDVWWGWRWLMIYGDCFLGSCIVRQVAGCYVWEVLDVHVLCVHVLNVNVLDNQPLWAFTGLLGLVIVQSSDIGGDWSLDELVGLDARCMLSRHLPLEKVELAGLDVRWMLCHLLLDKVELTGWRWSWLDVLSWNG